MRKIMQSQPEHREEDTNFEKDVCQQTCSCVYAFTCNKNVVDKLAFYVLINISKSVIGDRAVSNRVQAKKQTSFISLYIHAQHFLAGVCM